MGAMEGCDNVPCDSRLHTITSVDARESKYILGFTLHSKDILSLAFRSHLPKFTISLTYTCRAV